MPREGSGGVVNFEAGVLVHCPYKLIAYGENALFLWNLLLLSRAWSGQGECTGMMIREGSAGVVDFMKPGTGVLC